MTNEQQNGAMKLPADDNLIQLASGTGEARQTRDINAKINLLETSLGSLQSELDQINRSVDEGLERLGDTDLDLTAKVSETYKRLGEIDNTYKTLSTLSDSIDSEVRKLTFEISDLVEKSEADLEEVAARSAKRDADINQQHEQLVARVNELVVNSKQTHAQLEHSIKTNTDALLGLEKQLAEEIRSLTDTTEELDSKLESGLDDAQKAIAINHARMLQMQAVDEALARRADTLESTAAVLTRKSGDLGASVDVLNARSDELSLSIKKLRELTDSHTGLIDGIQKNVAQMGHSIYVLATTQKKHFRLLSGLIALVVLAIGAFYYYQLDTNQINTMQMAERSQVVDRQLAGLQQQDSASVTMLSQLQQDLQSLGSNVNEDLVVLNERLSEEVNTLQAQLQDMEDQAQSLDGRLDYVSPFSSFGRDSIIHGPQWLAAQPADRFAIVIARVSDRSSLYEIAQRYSHYFKDDMAYYTVDSDRGQRFALVYGSFASKSDANTALYRMPRSFEFQRPQVRQIGELQKLI